MRRLLFGFASACFIAAGLVAACSDDESTNATTTTGDASIDRSTRTDGGGGEGEDDAATATDAGTKDAAKDAKATRDANGPGEAGTTCVFNADCQLALRCSACNGFDCFCDPGARGTGQNGITACDSGDQCASAFCVEGPGDSGVSYCSDECESSADCTGMLPKCVTIASFASFCARDGG